MVFRYALAAFLLLSGFAFTGSQLCQVNEDTRQAPEDDLVVLAQSLPHEGILVQSTGGFAYLKVDDRFIHALYPRLPKNEGFQKPPYFRRPDSPGAHISVVYENEDISLREVGRVFPFSLKKIKSVHSRGVDYLILEVESPELEELRRSYGLTPKLNNHEFHITIAIKGGTV